MAIKAQVIDNGQPVAKVDTDTAKNAKLPYVISVNGKRGDVEITPESIGALPKGTKIPGKTSELVNDAGFVNAAGAAEAAPVQSVNGETGDVELDIPTKTSDLDNDSGFVDEAGAAEAAPIQSVNGETGDIVGLLSAYQGTETVLQAGDDLDAITTPGEYRIPDGDTVGALLLHRPDNYASSGRLIVLEGGNPVYRTQILMTTGVVPTVTYMRSGYYSSTQQAWRWWDWKASGAPLNAGRFGKAIPEDADLNSSDYAVLGEYYISGAAVAATVTCGEDPIPYTAGSSRLLVLRSGNGSGIIQILFATGAANLYVYMRTYASSQWYGWRRLLYTVDGGIPVSTTPDTSSNNTQIATTAFVRAAMANYAPVTSVNGMTGDVVVQGGSGGGTDTSAVHTSRSGTSIPSGANLNSYYTIGEYYIASSTVAANVANNPYPSNSRLFVFAGGNASYRIQLLLGGYGVAGSAIFVRASNSAAGSSMTWGDWVGIGGSSEPFFAEYGVTTSAQIEAAFQAGRPIFCKREMTSGSVLYYVLSYRYTATSHWFTSVYGSIEYQVNCSADEWTFSNRNLVKSVNGLMGTNGAVVLTAENIEGIPTKTSDLENDSWYVSQGEINEAEHNYGVAYWYGPRVEATVKAKSIGRLSRFRYAFRMPAAASKRPTVTYLNSSGGSAGTGPLTVEHLLKWAAIDKSVYAGYDPPDFDGSHPTTGDNSASDKQDRAWKYVANGKRIRLYTVSPVRYDLTEDRPVKVNGTETVKTVHVHRVFPNYVDPADPYFERRDSRRTMCSDSVINVLINCGYDALDRNRRDYVFDNAPDQPPSRPNGTVKSESSSPHRYNQYVEGEKSLPQFLYEKGWKIIWKIEDLKPGDVVFTKTSRARDENKSARRFNPGHVFVYVGPVSKGKVPDWTQGDAQIQLHGAGTDLTSTTPLAYDNGRYQAVINYDAGGASGKTDGDEGRDDPKHPGVKYYWGGLNEALFWVEDEDNADGSERAFREPSMLWEPTLFGFRGDDTDPEADGNHEWRGVTSSCIFKNTKNSDKRFGLLGEMYCPRSLRYVDWLTYFDPTYKKYEKEPEADWGGYVTEKINYPICWKQVLKVGGENTGITTLVKYSKAGIMEVQIYGTTAKTASDVILSSGQDYTLFDFSTIKPEELRTYPVSTAAPRRFDAFMPISSADIARIRIIPVNSATGPVKIVLRPTSNVMGNYVIAASFTTMRPTTI